MTDSYFTFWISPFVVVLNTYETPMSSQNFWSMEAMDVIHILMATDLGCKKYFKMFVEMIRFCVEIFRKTVVFKVVIGQIEVMRSVCLRLRGKIKKGKWRTQIYLFLFHLDFLRFELWNTYFDQLYFLSIFYGMVYSHRGKLCLRR